MATKLAHLLADARAKPLYKAGKPAYVPACRAVNTGSIPVGDSGGFWV